MVMLDVSATGEDNVISKDPSNMKDLEYRKKQLKQLQNEVIDIEDVQGNISISDLTFNDFKIDLEKTSREELKTIEKLPQSSFSVVKSNTDHIHKGIIFCLKDKSGEKSENYGSNVLYPYFLIYKSLNGSQNIKSSQPKITLDYLRKLCINEDELNPRVIEKFEDRTSKLKRMDEYQSLLKESISEVRGVQEEIGLDSLATSGGTLFSDTDDFSNENIQLINYLIIE